MAAKGRAEDWITEDGLLVIEGWAREGLTDKQICQNIGIGQTAFYNWIKRYPQIREALKKGKAPVDIQVENALLKRALGYEYVEKTTEIYTDINGNPRQHVRSTTKFVPPDVTAQIYWLKNRKPEQWRDKREVEMKTEADDPLLQLLARWNDAANSKPETT